MNSGVKSNPKPELESLAREQMKLFGKSPFDPSLFSHKLSGKLKGKRAFRINYQYRIVFQITPDGNALFDHIGDHDEVY
ncbi:MAG TPA: type II toxin-antitoxin system mRNA interferase toxin, RelE/StbE family [Candidatus Kapabacteria bacterium]|jgi:mRNA-degrading endonuclease YafQ of YafQ-DinJ toxin-antitoxin module